MGLRIANRRRFAAVIGLVAAAVFAAVLIAIQSGGDDGGAALSTVTSVRRTTTTVSTTTTVPPTTTSTTRRTTITTRRVSTATTTPPPTRPPAAPPLACNWNETFWPGSPEQGVSDFVKFTVQHADMANAHFGITFTYTAPAHGPSGIGVKGNPQGSASTNINVDRSMDGGTITAKVYFHEPNDPSASGSRNCTSPTYAVRYTS